MVKDILPEGKTYWSRACRFARVYSTHKNLRCSNCPFRDCIQDNPNLRNEVLVAKIALLIKAK